MGGLLSTTNSFMAELDDKYIFQFIKNVSMLFLGYVGNILPKHGVKDKSDDLNFSLDGLNRQLFTNKT